MTLKNENHCHPELKHFAKNMCKKCYFKKYRSDPKNRQKAKESLAKWEKDHLKEVNERKKQWLLNNKEKYREVKKQYVSRNLAQCRAQCAKRHAAKIRRTPAWADLNAIKQFYINCPIGMEVDHIIPLQGESVSGFHILENLQYLDKSENRRKHNNFDLKIGNI